MTADQLGNLLGALSLSIVTDIESALESSTAQSLSHGTAIMAIVQQPGLSIDKLRKILRLSHSGTVRVTDRLVAAGMVVRKAGSDGRTVSLEATRAGEKIYEAIATKRLDILKATHAKLTAEERTKLGQILTKLLRGSAATVSEAQRVCRMCKHSVCYSAGNCPVAASVTAE